MTTVERTQSGLSRHERIAQLRNQIIAVWIDTRNSDANKKNKTMYLLEQQGRSMSFVEFRRYLNNFLTREKESEFKGLADIIKIKLKSVFSVLNEHVKPLYGALAYAQHADIAIRPDLFYTWTEAIVELFRYNPFWDDIRFSLLRLYRNFKTHTPKELGLDCKQTDYLSFIYQQDLIIKKVLKIRRLCKLHDFESCNRLMEQVMRSAHKHPRDFMVFAESLLLIQKTMQYDSELVNDDLISGWIGSARQKIIQNTPILRYS